LRIPLSTGREWDKETGLYYYRARYYDPMEGRFISKDPIGFDGNDVNLYGYVSNNAINFTDPKGNSPDWWNKMKEWVKNFLQSCMWTISPEFGLSSASSLLLEKESFDSGVAAAVSIYNQHQATEDCPDFIDAQWAQKHPQEALQKIANYFKSKKHK
jgi:RHS repeat-associated protein